MSSNELWVSVSSYVVQARSMHSEARLQMEKLNRKTGGVPGSWEFLAVPRKTGVSFQPAAGVSQGWTLAGLSLLL